MKAAARAREARHPQRLSRVSENELSASEELVASPVDLADVELASADPDDLGFSIVMRRRLTSRRAVLMGSPNLGGLKFYYSLNFDPNKNPS
jgi:hypothetical protein